MILLDLVNRGRESGLLMQNTGILLAITAKSDGTGRNRKWSGLGGGVLIVGVNGNDDGSQVYEGVWWRSGATEPLGSL